jgi:hypothetical protein
MNKLVINTEKTNNITSPTNFLQVEDFDEGANTKFIKEWIVPYFKDLYRDL